VFHVCQPRGQCASVDDVDAASSECKALIYCTHNLHSLFNYSVDLVLVDHGHMRLGYELSSGSNVHSIAPVHSVLQERYGISRCSSVMVIPVHCTGNSTAE